MPTWRATRAFLAQYVDDMTHLRLAVAEGKGTKGDIRLVHNPKLKGTASERYQVTVGAKGIVVTGATPPVCSMASRRYARRCRCSMRPMR
jgi:hypothetical protein